MDMITLNNLFSVMMECGTYVEFEPLHSQAGHLVLVTFTRRSGCTLPEPAVNTFVTYAQRIGVILTTLQGEGVGLDPVKRFEHFAI